MELKLGYKQTEVGVIPEDWAVKPLYELFAFSGGYTASRAQLSNEGHCYLHYGDIHGTSKTTVDTSLDYSDIPKLEISLSRVSRDSLLDDGDVVFVDASEDDEGASKHVVVINKDCLPFISGLHTIVAKTKTADLDPNYRRYCFKTQAIRRQFLFYAVGTKVTGISKSNIRKLFLPLPSLSAQCAIAAALSDVDALLDSLGRLIAKKRDLKQAAMQKLLNGKTRLSGFEADWKVVTAGDIGRFRGGTGFPTRFQGATFGKYPFFKVSDMNNKGNETFMETSNNYISEALRKQIGAVLFSANSIVFAKVGAAVFLERKKILTRASCLDNNMAGYVVDDTRADFRFIHYVLLNMKLGDLVSTTALPSLSGRVLAAIEFILPPFKEQTAIATVLSDMDAEITALEKRYTKTRDLKQAMMQELLTGKTRLVITRRFSCLKDPARTTDPEACHCPVHGYHAPGLPWLSYLGDWQQARKQSPYRDGPVESQSQDARLF